MKKVVVFFLAALLFSSPVFAFSIAQLGNKSGLIAKNYSLGGTIKGWTNISLNNELANSTFSTNFGSKISLIDLISKNPAGSFQYSCVPVDCNSDYLSDVTAGIDSKTFALETNASHVVGLKFGGGSDFGNVQKFSMSVDSDAGKSVLKQLFIDILDDKVLEWQAYNYSGDFGGDNYGCYNTGIETTAITTNVLCEKINMPVTPAVQIGTVLIDDASNTDQNARLIFTIDNEKGSSGTCTVDATAEGTVSCSPQGFSINNPDDYYVCVKAATSGDQYKYNINSEKDANSCGYATSKSFVKDYKIFARAGKFSAVGTFVLNNTEAKKSNPSIGTIESGIENYIEEKYGNDCSDECVVPIRITSKLNSDQTITLSGVSVIYSAGGEGHNENNFPIYEVRESPARVTSGFIKLNLDSANFSIPGIFGKRNFSLNFSNTQILSQEIEVLKVPQIVSLNPKVVVAAFAAEFSVRVEKFGSPANITKYEWKFDSEQSVSTTANATKHTFSGVGNHTVEIGITNSEGFSSSKIFTVEVATPKNSVNLLLNENVEKLNNLKTQIENFTQFEQDSLNAILGLNETDAIISDLQQRNAVASSDEDYISMVNDLVLISIPDSVDLTARGDSLLFLPEKENINIEALKVLESGDYSNEEEYIDAIVLWNLDNIISTLSFNKFAAISGDTPEEIMSSFEISINSNPEINGAYLIIPQLENLAFEGEPQKKEENGYVLISLDGGENIGFSTTEDIDFTTLSAFISPPLSKLSVSAARPIGEAEPTISKTTLVILVVLLVGFIGFIAYIILHQWYKRKYESHLFKNRNDLYNIISYVHNMKKQGVEDKKVAVGLKKAGWGSEQVTYIMRKYYGKRTGMFEIPFGKIFGGKPSQQGNFQQGGFSSRKI